MHLPTSLIFHDVTAVGLVVKTVMTSVLGILLAIVFLRTKNVIVAIGVHTMLNAPLSIVAGSSLHPMIYLVVTTGLLLVFWRRIVDLHYARAQRID